MSDLNVVNATGRLTDEPELRYTPNGKAVADVRMAINNSYKPKGSDEWEDDPCFITVTFWGQTAETISEHFNKGEPIVITGNLKQDRWSDDDGNKRTKIKIKGRNFNFPPSSGGNSGPSKPQTSQPEPSPQESPESESDSEGAEDQFDVTDDEIPF